jgi:hypothetical protein
METPELQMLPYLTLETKGQEVRLISERFIYVGFRIVKHVLESCYSCTRAYEIVDEIQLHVF